MSILYYARDLFGTVHEIFLFKDVVDVDIIFSPLLSKNSKFYKFPIVENEYYLIILRSGLRWVDYKFTKKSIEESPILKEGLLSLTSGLPMKKFKRDIIRFIQKYIKSKYMSYEYFLHETCAFYMKHLTPFFPLILFPDLQYKRGIELFPWRKCLGEYENLIKRIKGAYNANIHGEIFPHVEFFPEDSPYKRVIYKNFP